jgi:hypothetical protein
MRIRNIAAVLAAVMLVGGCSDSATNDAPEVGPTDPTSGNGAPPPVAGVGSFKAVFDASSGLFPYPTDGYFIASNDGTLNIPATLALFPRREDMNALDGWSTTASSVFRMSQAVKNDAAMLNSNLRIIEVVMLRQSSGPYAPVAPSPLRGPNPVLLPGVDYSARLSPDADALGTVVEIQWLKPLNASAGVGCPAPLPAGAICGIGYVVLVTNGIQNTSGTAATPDVDYLAIRTEAIAELGRAQASGNPATFVPTCPGITDATLKSLCTLTYTHLATGARLPPPATVNPTSVILSYSFTTQSTRDAVLRMSQTHTAQPITAVPTGRTTADLLPAGASPGWASVYAGSLQVPYYLAPAPANYAAPNSACSLVLPNPTRPNTANPLLQTWTAAGASTVPGISATSRHITRFNLVPEKKADLTIPMLVFRPSPTSPSGGVKPANGWPVVVFMHGLGGDRTNATAIADAYASRGFAVVAIDQVLHGITSRTNPLYAGAANPAAAVLYPAGTRERTFDIDCLTLGGPVPLPAPDGVTDNSGFNAIVIGVAASLVQRDIFRQTGSDLITLVKSLPNLDLDSDGGGDIDMSQVHYAGHSLGGIVGPACICSEMDSYYLNVPGGPYGEIARTSPTFAPIVNGLLAFINPLLQPNTALYSQFFRETLALIDAGDPVNYVARLAKDRPVLFTKVVGDTTVPNATTDYLLRTTGATKVTAAGLNPVAAGAPRFVTFLSGNHSSLLSPAGGLAVTQEMQQQAVSLVVTGGTAVAVTNQSLIEQ